PVPYTALFRSVVGVVRPHVAGEARLGLAGLLEAEAVAGVAGDAAVAVLQRAGVDVPLLLVAPVAGVGRAGLGVARVAAHLHDDARHLRVVRHADVALPVDPEAAGAGAVRVAGIDDVVTVDLDVTPPAGRLRDAAARCHDRVVVRAVAVRAGELLL